MSDLARIEDNVRTMIGKGAPEADIDAYLKTEGHTPDSFKKAMGEPSTAAKIADKVNTGVNWFGTQITKGATGLLGSADALGTLAEKTGEWAGEKVGAPETGRKVGAGIKRQLTFHGAAPNTEAMNRFIFGSLGVPEVNAGDNSALTLTNPFGIEGKVNVGKMLDTGVQAIPGSFALGGGALPAMLGGMTSEAAGQATAGTPYELPARIVGSLPGAYVGSKLTTPLPANLTPQQARAVELAKANGVPLSVGQETGRGVAAERFFSRMPGGQGLAEKFAGRQGARTDEMALAEVGYKGKEVGQETLKGVARQAGDEFNAAKNMPGAIDLAPTFPKVREAVAKYEGIMDPARRSPAVTTEANRFLSKEPGPTPIPPLPAAEIVRRPKPTLDNLTTAVRNASKPVDEAFERLPDDLTSWFRAAPRVPMPKAPPELSNVQYQTLRKGLTDAVDDLYRSGDTNAAKALQAMRTALDDAAEASLGPDKLAAWKEARKHYFNFKIIEKAMNTGNASARSEGTLGTAALERALKSKQGDAFYRTTGGLNDVATIKGYLRDTFPNSGTPTIGAQLAAVANPLTGFALGGANNLAMRAMTGAGPISSVVRNYLANQSMPSRLESVATVPFALAPGLLTDHRLMLPDLRGRQ